MCECVCVCVGYLFLFLFSFLILYLILGYEEIERKKARTEVAVVREAARPVVREEERADLSAALRSLSEEIRIGFATLTSNISTLSSDIRAFSKNTEERMERCEANCNLLLQGKFFFYFKNFL